MPGTRDPEDPPVDAQEELKFRRWRDEERLAYLQEFEDGADDDDYPAGELVCVRDANDREIIELIESQGFTQDPDVLDTWFSSALWPHSTLGWPERTPELAKWYPTSVLLTGRDIITLWVARMVMMGMYNMGEAHASRGTGFQPVREEAASQGASRSESERNQHGLKTRATGKRLGIPFYDVAINPTILDGKGERMSKSKGNGVDPVDIIDGYGADALRFTLTTMATETQDVRMPVKKDAQGRNTSEKFDLGRNFCNKLWNAARFALSNLESVNPEPPDAGTWSLADRWIVSRFNGTIAEADAALAAYRFDQYAKSCYDFFWRDLCDWYLEAIKPAMKDPSRAGQTANVLAAALDGVLRLMHPMIPFITETIWWRLNAVRPGRGLPGKIDCPPSERLVAARWPAAGGPVDEAAEQVFGRLQEIIGCIRNLRNEHKVDVKRPLAVSILAPGDFAGQAEANREMIEILANARLKAVGPDLAPPANATRAACGGCEVFVEGLVDADAERQRREKRVAELEKMTASLRGRLSNESYLAKAPPNLVQQTRDQLAEAEAELAKLTPRGGQ